MSRNHSTPPQNRRNLAVIAGVLSLHVLALWALQTGLLYKAAEMVIPVEAIASLDAQTKSPPALKKPEPVKPVVLQPREAPQPAPAPVPSPAVPVPAPVPVAIQEAIPTPNSAAGTSAIQPGPSPIGTSPAASKSANGPTTVASKVELPSSSAEYLHNPKPIYPNASKRRGEQGMVLVSVLIGADGVAQDAKVKTSSGFELLDQAALNTVKSWKYVPGKRGGVPEAMWFNVPINFVLE